MNKIEIESAKALFEELLERKARFEVSPPDSDRTGARAPAWEVSICGNRDATPRDFQSPDLCLALAAAVDFLRLEAGERSLADEAEALEAEAEAPDVPACDRCPRCGSRFPLILRRTVELFADWSRPGSWLHTTPRTPAPPGPRELLSCQNCAASFHFKK